MNTGYPTPSPNELMQHMVDMLSQQKDLMARMVDAQSMNGLKLDSRLPSYGESLTESHALFYDQVVQYFEARNVSWQDPSICTRVLAVLGKALHGTAAQWYVMMKSDIQSVQQFFELLELEFVPADLQIRLREELRLLNQRHCRDLSDYITRFRGIMNQVTQMTYLDKVVYFNQGLLPATRVEVQYRRCTKLADAITVALDFDRSHYGIRSGFSRQERRTHHQERTNERYPRLNPRC